MSSRVVDVIFAPRTCFFGILTPGVDHAGLYAYAQMLHALGRQRFKSCRLGMLAADVTASRVMIFDPHF